ncbi:MAG: restriction endonuclease subunit S [Ignavibacteria bacterium]|nr:restriction endonuclease subunit S [Ignavibacteria bacterium]
MSEWKEYVLEDLVYVDKEQLNNTTDDDFSFYYIDISSVSTNKIQFPDSQISFKESPSRARKVLHDGDILMATVRPNLKAFARFNKPANRNYIASTGFAVLSKNEKADIDFIYHSLFSNVVEKQIEALVVGSNYPALNISDIRKLKIHSPSLTTQSKIARILSTCDLVIEKLKLR